MPHKLLVADDSVTIQRVIELTFADEDVQVIAVGDGKQAIARAQQDRPDIILADVGMPERDGYQVAEFVKRSPELQHIPVLLLTGAFEPIDEARARAVGCDGVLVKPFEPQLVINRVKDLISGRRETVQMPPRMEPASRPAAAQAPAAIQAPPAQAAAAPAGSIEDYFDRLDAAFSTLDGNAPPPAAQVPLARPAPDTRPSFDPPPSAAGERPREPFGGLADELAGWDPEIAGDPTRPAPMPAAPPPAARQRVEVRDEFNWKPAPEVPAPAMPPIDEPRYVPPAPSERQRVEGSERQRVEGPAPTLAEAFAALLAAEQGRPFSPAAGQPMTAPTADEQTLDEITRRVLDRMNAGVIRERVLDVAERLVREEIDRIKSAAR